MSERNNKRETMLLNRREALKVLGGATVAAGLGGFGPISGALASSKKKVMVLGIDGMDPHLLEMFLKMGKMPHTQRLIAMGGFSPLVTSIPPQSPVAWANFITGMNPGGHGIFDFIHRDPATTEIRVILSTTGFSCSNNGAHIPIQQKEGRWVPSTIFTEMHSGSNFSDSDTGRIAAGMNGLGIKLAAILSEEFVVE